MEIINHLHSILRWAILVFLILTIVKARSSKIKQISFAEGVKKTALISMMLLHTQLVIGIIQYVVGARGLNAIKTLGMKEVMGDSVNRFYAMEHLVGMLIAIIIITVGYSTAKRMTDAAKSNGRIFITYLIGLILIIASIPWPFRPGFAGIAGWF
jgi:hypothetical protein